MFLISVYAGVKHSHNDNMEKIKKSDHKQCWWEINLMNICI